MKRKITTETWLVAGWPLLDVDFEVTGKRSLGSPSVVADDILLDTRSWIDMHLASTSSHPIRRWWKLKAIKE